MKKSKTIVQCISWLLLFTGSQLFLYIGATYFFQKEAYIDYKEKYPSVSINQDTYIESYMKTEQYPKQLQIYIENHTYIFILINLLWIPILFHFYPLKDKWKNKPQISFFKTMGLAISLSLFLNLFIGCFGKPQVTSISFWVLISTGILGPILEEFLFRGILYEKSKQAFSKKTSFWFVTLLFALIHTGTTIFYAFFMGILFLYLQEKGKHIKPAIYAHIITNFLVPICMPILFSISLPLRIILLFLCLLTFLYFLLSKKQNM